MYEESIEKYVTVHTKVKEKPFYQGLLKRVTEQSLELDPGINKDDWGISYGETPSTASGVFDPNAATKTIIEQLGSKVMIPLIEVGIVTEIKEKG